LQSIEFAFVKITEKQIFVSIFSKIGTAGIAGIALYFFRFCDNVNLIGKYHTNSLSKKVFPVKPLFKRFKRFEKPLYGLKRPIFESELVSGSCFFVL